MPYAIANGDVLACLRELPPNEFDALMCDPPYGLSFMGKRWDYDVPSVDVWREALRVLKPGAPLVAFGGSRTYHRMAVAIEDAGFELRDCLMWLYGKGFPKSLDVSKAIDNAAGAVREVVGVKSDPRYLSPRRNSPNHMDRERGVEGGHGEESKAAQVTAPATDLARTWSGYGTALKPAFEPIVLARKPLDGTGAANVAKWGVGGLAIDACRIEASGRPAIEKTGERWAGSSMDAAGSRAVGTTDQGRWPANVVLDEAAGAMLDEQSGPSVSRIGKPRGAKAGAGWGMTKTGAEYADSGGASRFFYCSKVSTKEREAGMAGTKNHHPTLKPISLTSWLARLIMPPTEGAQLLVPYSGAGSEMIGALKAGWSVVFGIEGDADYVEIAHARIRHHVG